MDIPTTLIQMDKKFIELEKKLTNSKNLLLVVSNSIRDLEKLLIDNSFMFYVEMECYLHEKAETFITIYWKRNPESNKYGLYCTKIYNDDEIKIAVEQMTHLKVEDKFLIFPYLIKFMEKVEKKNDELTLFINKI